MILAVAAQPHSYMRYQLLLHTEALSRKMATARYVPDILYRRHESIYENRVIIVYESFFSPRHATTKPYLSLTTFRWTAKYIHVYILKLARRMSDHIINRYVVNGKTKTVSIASAAVSILMKTPRLQIGYGSSSEIGNRYDEWIDWNNRSSK